MGDISKNFSMSEFACHDGTHVPERYRQNVVDLVERILQPLRNHVGVPVIIRSGYRTPSWNKKVGGVDGSQHLVGKAADILVPGFGKIDLYNLINNRFDPPGLGIYDSEPIHVDIRPGHSRWDWRKSPEKGKF